MTAPRPPADARRAARRAIRAKRAAARDQLRRARAAARETPAGRRRARRRDRRRRLALLALLVVIYLLLRGCDCDDPPPIDPPAPGAGAPSATPPEPAAAPPPASPPAPRRPRLRVEPTARPDYQNPTPAPPDWLAALRLQVAARAPRLARCFEGIDRPGALRWSAALDRSRGAVSDHRFDPVLGGVELPAALRACLAAALTAPRYTLPAPDDDAPAEPVRFTIVIEF